MTKPAAATGNQQHYKENVINEREINTPEFKDYRRQWFENPQNNVVANFPLNLDIHITNICNLKCPFCPRTWKDMAGGYEGNYQHMDMDLYRKMTDEAVEQGVKAFHFTGNGEPLLVKELEEMIVYARQKGVLEIRVHTNATLLNERRSKSLLEAGVHHLAISFDSPNKETYLKLRIGASFEKTIENIKRFVSIRDQLGYQFPHVRVQMVVQKENVHERKQFDEMFGQFVDSTSQVNYINYNGGPNSDIYNIAQDKINGETQDLRQKKLNPNFKCSYLWQRLIIEPDGNVYPCFYNDNLLLGNVKEQTLKQIWDGPKMQLLRTKHAAGRFCDIKECAGCGRQYETVEEDKNYVKGSL